MRLILSVSFLRLRILLLALRAKPFLAEDDFIATDARALSARLHDDLRILR